MPSTTFRTSAVTITLLLLCAASRGQSLPSCSVTFLGEAQGVGSLNELGVAIGQKSVGSATRGWVASASAPLALLPLPAGDASSWALDINEQGVIVGAVSTTISPEFGGRAVKWEPTGGGGYAITELGKLPGHSGSVATALNNLGDVVGYSVTGMFRYPVLFSAPGGVLDLNPLAVFDPQAVNDRRQMLDKQCKRLDLDTMAVTTFPLPPGPISYGAITGYAINELGQIAGTAVLATSTSCVYQAARHMDDFGWQLLTSCSSKANAYDINAPGDVLFQAITTQTIVHLEGIGDVSPQQLVAPSAGPWNLIGSFGMDLNDARQLAAIATNTSTGITGAVLLTPIQTCQADLGFGGPGPARLAVCGGDLSTGTSADLMLWGAPEGGGAFLLAGLQSTPTAFFAGTLVPLPFLFLASIPTGPTGTAIIPIQGGGGAASVYVQSLYPDAGPQGGVGLSNAVRIDFLP